MNDENATAEEQRVARFVQAIERMHHDPAEAARIDLIIDEVDGPVMDEENQQIVVHVHNEGGGNITNISSGDTRPTERTRPKIATAPQHEERSRLAVPWLSVITVTLVAAAVLLSSMSESLSVIAAALPAMALLWLDVVRRPFRKRIRGEESVKGVRGGIRASGSVLSSGTLNRR
ncbi:hypothetical protein OG949_40350 (plasmid) [Streptomyces scopuliridis]|uniref:hypothetical protein n=1 Tax=Streptomyces scopuliridis TaxID=452529 RepID=UPI002DDB1E1A|nr:hypothetical protein [Streptomyces scopuliridis]WSB39011.1 hypothetical protein OG949_40350 [Streptomyces scopuliridis]